MTEGAVAVVFAEGEISDVPEMGGVVAREFNMLLDDAASAPETRALVIRVNSPGGDAVAAETIRAKIEEIRESGSRPSVSMGRAMRPRAATGSAPLRRRSSRTR